MCKQNWQSLWDCICLGIFKLLHNVWQADEYITKITISGGFHCREVSSTKNLKGFRWKLGYIHSLQVTLWYGNERISVGLSFRLYFLFSSWICSLVVSITPTSLSISRITCPQLRIYSNLPWPTWTIENFHHCFDMGIQYGGRYLILFQQRRYTFRNNHVVTVLISILLNNIA